MIKRKHRLKRESDFTHVRSTGQAYRHALLVLIASPNAIGYPRIGIAVGKRIGKAFLRNQVKRRLRAAIAPHLPKIEGGWDIIIIARKPVTSVSFYELQEALQKLFQRTSFYNVSVSQQE